VTHDLFTIHPFLTAGNQHGHPAPLGPTRTAGWRRGATGRASYDKPDPGAFTATPGSLGTTWRPTAQHANTVEGRGAATGEVK